MEVNVFIKKLRDRYAHKGVDLTEICISGTSCSIYLRRKGTDEVFGHCIMELPLDEAETFAVLDKCTGCEQQQGYPIGHEV